MSQDSLYLFEVHITKCIISLKQEGNISLFLRIGKTTSSFLKAKSSNDRQTIFESVLRCNCDQNALDTKRFSITLNLKGSNKENRVLGIVMIPIQSQVNDQFKTYKVSQSQDPEAVIELKYSISLIDGNSNSVKKGSGFNSVLSLNKQEDPTKMKEDSNIVSLKSSQKQKQKVHLLQTLFSTPKLSKLPVSQFIQEVKTMKRQQNSQKSENQNLKLKQLNDQLLKQNQRLKRQKDFLKELLKVEIKKNNLLGGFLEKTYRVFAQRAIIEVSNLKNSQKCKVQDNFQKIQQSIDSYDFAKDKNQLYNSVGSIGQNSSITTSLGQNSQKPRIDVAKMDKIFASDSKISLSRISNINEQLSLLVKESIIKQRQQSRNAIQQLRKVIMDETDLKHQRRLRSVKIKIEKSYLQLFKQPQPFTKELIMKQKVSVNKILDDLVMCNISA